MVLEGKVLQENVEGAKETFDSFPTLIPHTASFSRECVLLETKDSKKYELFITILLRVLLRNC